MPRLPDWLTETLLYLVLIGVEGFVTVCIFLGWMLLPMNAR